MSAQVARKIVVVGGGNAAGYFARAVVAAGKGADLCIVAAEDVLPYERPALSKGFLHKESPPRLPGFHTCVGGGGERQTKEWYDANGVEVMLGTRVTAADLVNKTVTTDAGSAIAYEKLVVATGCTALRLPQSMGGGLPGVHYLRDNADALALYDAMGAAKRAVVIGGGYIGLECAAALATWGMNPHVVLMEPHVMARRHSVGHARPDDAVVPSRASDPSGDAPVYARCSPVCASRGSFRSRGAACRKVPT